MAIHGVLVLLPTGAGRVPTQPVHRAGDGVLDGRRQCGGFEVDRVEGLLLVEQVEERVVGQRETGGPCRSRSCLGEFIKGHRGRRGRVALEFIVDYGAQVAVEEVVAVGLYCRAERHIVALAATAAATATVTRVVMVVAVPLKLLIAHPIQ